MKQPNSSLPQRERQSLKGRHLVVILYLKYDNLSQLNARQN